MIEKTAEDVRELARKCGWKVNGSRIALTGSVYIELVRDGREWVIIRVADHKQVYHRWLTTISIAPGDLWFEELEGILSQPFGEVGDILL